MEEELANLHLIDEEEAAFKAEAAVVGEDYKYCVVGRCLTDSVVHFPLLRNTVADLWHPREGISIINVGDGIEEPRYGLKKRL
ncbi:hypothetical protein J1N35_032861 [Gossypium stocksii]|uniref:DUF4283 domain-containing protein n=1 Tax=Gossypium stocksii TaxID=47602 RepID=A0A9D3V5B0_9ROSI|nr:hypothetical protein J1N35_032861 [Gossypium stocksii]